MSNQRMELEIERQKCLASIMAMQHENAWKKTAEEEITFRAEWTIRQERLLFRLRALESAIAAIV